MKIFTSVLLCFLHYIPAHAKDLDTVWTHDIGQYNNNSKCVRFMPDGKSIISGVGNTIYEFETASGKLMRKFAADTLTSDVDLLEIDPKGRFIVTSANYGKLYYWDYNNGSVLKRIQYNDSINHISSFCFSPDGKYLYMCLIKNLLIFNLENQVIENRIYFPSGWINKVAISKDGQYLVVDNQYEPPSSSIWKSRLQLWDAQNLTMIKQLDEITRDVRAIAFSPNSQKLVFLTSQDDGVFVRIYDLVNNKKEILSWDFLGIEPFGAIFCNDTNTLFLTGLDINKNRISKLYNMNSGKTYKTISYGYTQAGIDFNGADNICISSLYKLVCLDSKYIKTSVDKEPPQLSNCFSAFISGDYLNIKNKCNNNIDKVMIFDINGKLVKTYEAGYSGATVDLPFAAPAGVYLVRIVTDQSDYNFKFVRE